jgi:hypothetical protein
MLRQNSIDGAALVMPEFWLWPVFVSAKAQLLLLGIILARI